MKLNKIETKIMEIKNVYVKYLSRRKLLKSATQTSNKTFTLIQVKIIILSLWINKRLSAFKHVIASNKHVSKNMAKPRKSFKIVHFCSIGVSNP